MWLLSLCRYCHYIVFTLSLRCCVVIFVFRFLSYYYFSTVLLTGPSFSIYTRSIARCTILYIEKFTAHMKAKKHSIIFFFFLFVFGFFFKFIFAPQTLMQTYIHMDRYRANINIWFVCNIAASYGRCSVRITKFVCVCIHVHVDGMK